MDNLQPNINQLNDSAPNHTKSKYSIPFRIIRVVVLAPLIFTPLTLLLTFLAIVLMIVIGFDMQIFYVGIIYFIYPFILIKGVKMANKMYNNNRLLAYIILPMSLLGVFTIFYISRVMIREGVFDMLGD